jgi:hypothetical protein
VKALCYFSRPTRVWVLKWYEKGYGEMHFVVEKTFEMICLRGKYILEDYPRGLPSQKPVKQ